MIQVHFTSLFSLALLKLNTSYFSSLKRRLIATAFCVLFLAIEDNMNNTKSHFCCKNYCTQSPNILLDSGIAGYSGIPTFYYFMFLSEKKKYYTMKRKMMDTSWQWKEKCNFLITKLEYYCCYLFYCCKVTATFYCCYCTDAK